MLPAAAQIRDLLFPELKRAGEAARVLVHGLGHRAELVGIEMEEARDAAASSGLMFAVAAALFFLAALTLTGLLAAAFWDTAFRLPVLLTIAIAYAGGGVAVLLAARRRLRAWNPFSETTSQLKKDAQCLQELLNSRSQ